MNPALEDADTAVIIPGIYPDDDINVNTEPSYDIAEPRRANALLENPCAVVILVQ